MKRTVGIVSLIVALAVSFIALAPSAAHAGSITCKNKGSKTCGTGVSVTAYSGTFKVPVFQTRVVLRGQASKASHGVQIFAQRTVAARTPTHGVAFRVFSLGHLPRLTLVARGHLYEYVMARGTWVSVGAVTHPGIYAAVLS